MRLARLQPLRDRSPSGLKAGLTQPHLARLKSCPFKALEREELLPLGRTVKMKMNDSVFDRATTHRYLRLLGAERQPPSLAALSHLISAQLERVPFETISKLWHRKRLGLVTLPAISDYLDGIERCRFGGTCYANNYYFLRLLESLGYDVRLCGADMSTHNAHMVSMVRLEGREFLVDVGYGAPFFGPIPRDLPHDWRIHFGCEEYVLKPRDAAGASRVEEYRDGQYMHGCLALPAEQRLEDFSDVIAASFRPTATFMQALMLARFRWPKGSVLVWNLAINEAREDATAQTRQVLRSELPREIERLFGIPSEIAVEAIAELPEPMGVLP